MKPAALILAALLTGCASPQYQLAEGSKPGQHHIEAARTDVYSKFIRVWNTVQGWFVFRW